MIIVCFFWAIFALPLILAAIIGGLIMNRIEEEGVCPLSVSTAIPDPTSGWDRFSFETGLPRLTLHQTRIRIEAARWQAACQAREAYLANLVVQAQSRWIEGRQNTPEPRYSRAVQARLGFQGHPEFKEQAIAAAATAIERSLMPRPGRALAALASLTH